MEETNSEKIYTLSSRLTFVNKFGSLVFCIIGVSSILFLVFVVPHSPKNTFIILSLAVAIAFSYGTCARAKRVRLKGDVLRVSNFRKEIIIPLCDIDRVSGSLLMAPELVWLHLKKDTDFGEKIVFMAKWRLLGGLSRHPVVEELRKLIMSASRSEQRVAGDQDMGYAVSPEPIIPGSGEKKRDLKPAFVLVSVLLALLGFMIYSLKSNKPENISGKKTETGTTAASKQAEPKKANPSQVQPNQPQPKQALPDQPQSKQAETRQSEAKKAGPAPAPLVLTAKDYLSRAEKTKDAKEKIALYSKAVELEPGNAQVLYNLGLAYYMGQGVEKDHTKAAAWFRKAAERGHAGAQTYLGIAYEHGYGVMQDYAQAAEWYHKAAEHGSSMAQYNLGVLYAYGRGVALNYTQAADWYRKAAEQGHAGAQNNLAVAYSKGHGVAADANEAANWYRKAAEQGNQLAQASLGHACFKGQGVPQDYVQAYMWCKLAEGRGNKIAGKYLVQIEKKMNPEQIAEAQELVRNWKPKKSR